MKVESSFIFLSILVLYISKLVVVIGDVRTTYDAREIFNGATANLKLNLDCRSLQRFTYMGEEVVSP